VHILCKEIGKTVTTRGWRGLLLSNFINNYENDLKKLSKDYFLPLGDGMGL